MSAKVQFSWNNQKGIGFAIIFFGWAIIFQIPAFIHSYIVLNLTQISDDIFLYIGLFVSVTAILGGLMASIYENLYEYFTNRFFNLFTLLIFCFIIFYLFYLFFVPFIETLEPYLAIPRKLEIQGWNRFVFSVLAGLFGIILLFLYSETRK